MNNQLLDTLLRVRESGGVGAHPVDLGELLARGLIIPGSHAGPGKGQRWELSDKGEAELAKCPGGKK